MDDRALVDGYNDHCYGSLLVHKVGALLPRPSTRRRLARSLRRGATFLVAACTLGTVVLVAPPLTITSGAVSQHLRPPPNTIHHTKIIGHIQKIPATCGPVPPPSPPPPSITTLAYVAEASNNEIQTIDEATGALVGTPITVGTSPKGIGYWRPPTSSHFDPEVVVSNSGSHSVTLIDAITQSVIATISVPSGSTATAVATSPTNDFALVVDTYTGKVSVINLNTNVDQGEISLTSTANVLTGIAFSPSGQYAYVTDPSQHKIFVIQHTVGTSPYYAYDTTYSNASYDFSGIGSDHSSTSSGSFYVTDAQASGYLLKFTVAGTLSAPTQVVRFNSPSMTPGAISVAPGSTDAWVAMTGTYKVDHVTLPGGAITTDTVNSSFSAVGPIGLSADGATLLAADTASGSVQELATTTGTATNSTAADSTVWAIAPALASPGSWDAYVAAGSNVDVVNTSTLSLTQSIADANGPIALAVSPDGQYVYVANETTPSISVIQTSLVGTTPNPVVATFSIPQGSEPHAPIPSSIAVNPQGTTLLVGDGGNGAVDVIDMNSADSQYKTVVARIGLFGSGISSSAGPEGITVGPQGTFAYVTEGSSTSATDGVAVLQYTGSTTTGYSFLADNEALSQGSDTMYAPAQITINPNGESAYVEGFYSSGVPNVVFRFPIGTNGELSNGSGSPVGIGYNAAGLTLSPEDQSVFATSTTSYEYSSISIPANSVTYDSATDNSGPGAIAVSADGLYVAVGETAICGHGADGVALYDAGTGTELASPVALTSAPQSIAFAPQSSPQTVSTSELVGNASNPAESAISSGMNDVVTSGTPSDAPGASAGVDTATGAYSLSIDSMTIPDIGISLDQSATYDSSRASVAGLLGKGWDYTYGITASQNSHSASTNPCAIVVTQEDGATVTFFPSAQGPYSSCPTSGYQAPGWAQATMTFQSSCNGTDSCFVMTRGAMTKYYVDETTGQLVKVADLNGNTVTITWGSHSACSGATSTEPCQVTAADGIRTLTYSYPSPGSGTCPSGVASCVVVTDPLGRTLTYALNSSSQLASVSLSNGSQTDTYAFAYNSSSQLTSWWDPNNNAAHAGNTTYATDVTWTSGKVTQVTGPPIASVAPLSTTAVTPTTTFTYTGFTTGYAGTTGNGTVLVDNPDFNQSNYEPGASQTLDTYAAYQLVSSVVGYGPVTAYYNGATAPVVPPNPSEAAYPLRDGFNLMPSESMNALAGTTVPAIGTQSSGQYDSGISITTYDAHGNPLATTDQSGNTTTSTYNGLDEVLSSTDALGNTTANTYNSTGQLLTTTPPANSTGGVAKTSNWYNLNGTICASRDAIETNVHGALSSCVSAGSNATTYTYDSSGDQTLSTMTDTTTPSTVTSTTQSVYDADGDVCATLSPKGYALGALSGCPTAGTGYATVNLNLNEYNQPTKMVSSLTIGTPNTYATSYTCTDASGNTTASVGPLGSSPTCSSLNTTTMVDTTFSTYDPSGGLVQSISPLATSGTQGPTTTSSFDADGNSALSLSPYGYVVWVANNSATLTPYETSSFFDDMGNQVSTAPATDNVASCVDNAGNPCPDTSITTYDNQGQSVAHASAGNGQSSTSPTASTTIVNPNGTTDGRTSKVGGGSTGVTETSQTTYNAAGATTNSVTEHQVGSTWVTDSATSTAYAPDGSTCWTSQTTVTSPSCASPPSSGGSTTTDYYDLAGHVVAQVGPGGSGTVEPGGSCDPTAALGTYSVNTSDLCAFTTYSVYNEAGQFVETIQPSLSSSTSGYVSAGATTTYGYDLNGNQTSEVNPAGNTVTTTYDAANRKTGVSYSDSSNTISYKYNVDATRSQMVDSTGTTTYSYNDAAQLSSVTDSNGNTVTYGYNQFGMENCVSYPGFSHTCSSSGAGTNSPPTGDITRDYDAQGRLSSVVDWNGDAFTYGYDCGGDVAWMTETPNTQIPTVAQCQGSSGSVPTAPTPPSGTTYVVTSYNYSPGSSGNLLTWKSTSAVTSSGPTALLGFGSSSSNISYDDNNNVTSVTPYKNGTAQAADAFGYDSQQRVNSGPETSGSHTSYSYVNTGGSPPFSSTNTVDQMGIDASPLSGSTAQLGSEYAGNGQLCWTAKNPSSSTGACSTPSGSASSYQTFSYDASGDRIGTTPTGGYGATSDLNWNQDTHTLSCANTSGITCTTPSSSATATANYTYNGDGLRMTATTWNAVTSSVQTAAYTWDTNSSALLSDGSYDYVYGLKGNVPIVQIDSVDSVTSVLLTDTNSNERGVVEVTPSSAHPYQLANYTDYDAYGNPMTASGGSANVGGLTNVVGSDADSSTRYGFGGGFEDTTGFIYLVHRYYDPGAAQFLSIDPLLGATLTPYSYATDNPVNRTDFLGMLNDAYHWSVAHIVYAYDESGPDIQTIASVWEQFQATLNGHRFELTYRFNWNWGPPVMPALGYYCILNRTGAQCDTASYWRKNPDYITITGIVWLSHIMVPRGNGTYNIWLEDHFWVQGYTGNGSRGEYVAPLVITPRIVCNTRTTAPCRFQR